MHPVVLLATGYAGLLLAVAAGLEWLARHTAGRSHRYRTAGFTYRPDHDLWMCPRNEPLWPYDVDRQHRLVRYRARPTVCNACPVKADCTSSHTGREIVQPIDPWPHSEAGRFHRGVSVTLTALAAAFLIAAVAAHHAPADLAAAIPAAALTGWLMSRWVRDLRHTPSGFPDITTVGHPGTREVANPAPQTPPGGPVLVELIPPSRRRGHHTAWGFDRQHADSRYRSARRPPPATTGEENR
jgi:hypothetical protein